MTSPPLLDIARAHLEGAVTTSILRATLLASPAATLHALERNDERLAAFLDGLCVSGMDAATTDDPDPMPPDVAIFLGAVGALEMQGRSTLMALIGRAGDAPEHYEALVAAFGWVPRSALKGIAADLLRSTDALARTLGLAACAEHRVDPGLADGPWLAGPDPLPRARAWRAVGELGLVDLEPACAGATADPDPECAFWAAWSGALLGNTAAAVGALAAHATAAGPHRVEALTLALQVMDPREGHDLLQSLEESAWRLRLLGGGVVGHPGYAGWLLDEMTNPVRARPAAEAFCLMTGLDLGGSGLETERPADIEPGPSDDPADEDVALHPDDTLPWPNVAGVRAWWERHGSQLSGHERLFMGAPPEAGHCAEVLAVGTFRQRGIAAQYLSLLEPGTPLFNIAAPAWRQRRRLARLRG